MKTAKRFSAVLLALIMIFSIFAFSASAEKEKPFYLVLGDSIAEGFGLTNPQHGAYGKIVADTNGYAYINRGHMGYDSADIRRLVSDTSGKTDIPKFIKEADIISLSVGGNDFLLGNVVDLLFNAIFLGNYSRFDTIAENYYENLTAIMHKIHELNPDAVILMQTLYNSWNSPVRKVYQQAADKINNAIYRVYDENPGYFEIVDVGSVFSFHKEWVTKDTIHPNAEGNVAIAKVVLEKLNELGLGDTTEPVIAVPGKTRDYITEYFGPIVGTILVVLANAATGNLF